MLRKFSPEITRFQNEWRSGSNDCSIIRFFLRWLSAKSVHNARVPVQLGAQDARARWRDSEWVYYTTFIDIIIAGAKTYTAHRVLHRPLDTRTRDKSCCLLEREFFVESVSLKTNSKYVPYRHAKYGQRGDARDWFRLLYTTREECVIMCYNIGCRGKKCKLSHATTECEYKEIRKENTITIPTLKQSFLSLLVSFSFSKRNLISFFFFSALLCSQSYW